MDIKVEEKEEDAQDIEDNDEDLYLVPAPKTEGNMKVLKLLKPFKRRGLKNNTFK